MTTLISGPTVTPLFVTSASARFTCGDAVSLVGGYNYAGGLAWGTANRAIYIPLSLPFAYAVARAWWYNSTTIAGNVDMGIYSIDGTKLFSTGSTAMSGSAAAQYVTVSWQLPPGAYYMAMVSSSATATFENITGSVVAQSLEQIGFLQQATALPLPSTMTPAAVTGTIWPFFGITRTASGH